MGCWKEQWPGTQETLVLVPTQPLVNLWPHVRQFTSLEHLHIKVVIDDGFTGPSNDIQVGDYSDTIPFTVTDIPADVKYLFPSQ